MYKNEAQEKWEQSPLYHVLKFRNQEVEQREIAMDDFLFWLDHVSEYEIKKDTRDDLQALINEYLGIDIGKVKRGELELLEKWKESVG